MFRKTIKSTVVLCVLCLHGFLPHCQGHIRPRSSHYSYRPKSKLIEDLLFADGNPMSFGDPPELSNTTEASMDEVMDEIRKEWKPPNKFPFMWEMFSPHQTYNVSKVLKKYTTSEIDALMEIGKVCTRALICF
jgi:hypothetical protein